MNKQQLKDQAQETMDLLSGKIEQATQCADQVAEKVKDNVQKAAGKVEHAVKQATAEVRQKQHKG